MLLTVTINNVFFVWAVVAVLVVIMLLLWVAELRRVRWLKQLKRGDSVRFYSQGQWRKGMVLNKVKTGATIRDNQNGRNYNVVFDNVKCS